jgi:multimeric flavodoxin WrbA
MKHILIVDGGPRRNMNTAALCDAFAEGARAASATRPPPSSRRTAPSR